MNEELKRKIEEGLKDTRDLEIALFNWLKSQNPNPSIALIALSEVLGFVLQQCIRDNPILGTLDLELSLGLIRKIATKASSNG